MILRSCRCVGAVVWEQHASGGGVRNRNSCTTRRPCRTSCRRQHHKRLQNGSQVTIVHTTAVRRGQRVHAPRAWPCEPVHVNVRRQQHHRIQVHYRANQTKRFRFIGRFTWAARGCGSSLHLESVALPSTQVPARASPPARACSQARAYRVMIVLLMLCAAVVHECLGRPVCGGNT